MVSRFDTRKSLDQEVLLIYKRAVAERRWAIAEPLMCAAANSEVISFARHDQPFGC